jgi:hypothetical protein
MNALPTDPQPVMHLKIADTVMDAFGSPFLSHTSVWKNVPAFPWIDALAGTIWMSGIVIVVASSVAGATQMESPDWLSMTVTLKKSGAEGLVVACIVTFVETVEPTPAFAKTSFTCTALLAPIGRTTGEPSAAPCSSVSWYVTVTPKSFGL